MKRDRCGRGFRIETADALDAVIVNTAGGMTGGDRFDIGIKVGAGARLTVTTAAAEKIYRSLGPDTEIDVTLEVGPGAMLAGCRKRRSCSTRPACAARSMSSLRPAPACFSPKRLFSAAPPWAKPCSGSFIDRWRVRVGGRWFLPNRPPRRRIAKRLQEPAIAGGGVAMASVLKIPGDEEDVAAVRAMRHDFAGEVDASAWNGLALARCVAADGAALRHDLMKVLTALGRRRCRGCG